VVTASVRTNAGIASLMGLLLPAPTRLYVPMSCWITPLDLLVEKIASSARIVGSVTCRLTVVWA